MPEKPRRRQHLVSRGYQRNFAADNTWVSVLDVHSGQTVCARRSIGANWRIDDFISAIFPDGTVDDALEREFGERERVFLRVVREIRLNQRVGPEQKDALDDLAAVHLARNSAFKVAHQKVVRGTLEQEWPKLAQDERLILTFARQWGRSPEPGELEAIVASAGNLFVSSPDFFTSGVQHAASGFRPLLAKWRVQLVGCADELPGFVLSDNPVVHGRRREGLFGFLRAGAIGGADMIVVPISRRLVAFYSARKLPDILIQTKNSVQWVNAILMQVAEREVLCHPDDEQATSRLIRNLDRYPAAKFDSINIH
ncbi:hypothetical protein PROP_01296 [Propionicimonas sp. T2.31MG-18]|uniref:DUF4238 domain-containing protein n=1 Tax=Propionicimonas sp. T2.31MG-18 TaxID=3157620 RepID=UPI0035EA059C